MKKFVPSELLRDAIASGSYRKRTGGFYNPQDFGPKGVKMAGGDLAFLRAEPVPGETLEVCAMGAIAHRAWHMASEEYRESVLADDLRTITVERVLDDLTTLGRYELMQTRPVEMPYSTGAVEVCRYAYMMVLNDRPYCWEFEQIAEALHEEGI